MMTAINSSEDIKNFLLSNPLKLEIRFHPKEKSILCKKDFSPSRDPIIYFRYDEPYAYQGKLYYSMTYYMYYKENYAIGLNGIFPTMESLGYHEVDLELVKVLFKLDLNTGIVKNAIDLVSYVYFSAHSQEGMWVPFDECEKDDNHLVVYSAYGSHANKPKSGTYMRILGFANDYTSYYGKWVRPNLINDQTYNRNVSNDEVLNTPLKRFLMPFYMKNLNKMKEEQKKIEDERNYGIV